jgi:LysR family transcriptional regulator, transcriptional activator of the cysJI operon
LVAYPSERRGLTATTFWRDKLKLICAPGHRLAGRRKIALNVLEGEKFIAFEPDLPTRREVDRRLKDAGVGVRMILEFDNIETVKRAVEIENGVSIVPETAVEDEVNAGSLAAIEIEGADMWRPLGALVRNAARVSPALREFLERLSHFEVLRNRHTVKSTKKVRRK